MYLGHSYKNHVPELRGSSHFDISTALSLQGLSHSAHFWERPRPHCAAAYALLRHILVVNVEVNCFWLHTANHLGSPLPLAKSPDGLPEPKVGYQKIERS